MSEQYKHVKALFQAHNYAEIIEIYQGAISDIERLHSWFWFDDCGLFAPLAYAYLGDYDKAIEAFQLHMKNAYCRKPQLALQKCGPAFIAKLDERQPASWSEVWYQMRHGMAPIETLVEDLWSPDLEEDHDWSRVPIYKALQLYGEKAIPALLNALAINDCNYEGQRFEKVYPKIALSNIGDAAFEALAKVIFSPPQIDVCGHMDTRVGRAAIKMLCRFGDERAEPVLRRALADPNVKYKDYIQEALEGIERRRKDKRLR